MYIVYPKSAVVYPLWTYAGWAESRIRVRRRSAQTAFISEPYRWKTCSYWTTVPFGTLFVALFVIYYVYKSENNNNDTNNNRFTCRFDAKSDGRRVADENMLMYLESLNLKDCINITDRAILGNPSSLFLYACNHIFFNLSEFPYIKAYLNGIERSKSWYCPAVKS
jgi:hypothetical protein